MDRTLIAVVMLLGGALQLYASFAAHRRVGPLVTLQGRQLEGTLGRRGTIAFFAVTGTVLSMGAVWLLAVS